MKKIEHLEIFSAASFLLVQKSMYLAAGLCNFVVWGCGCFLISLNFSYFVLRWFPSEEQSKNTVILPYSNTGSLS